MPAYPAARILVPSEPPPLREGFDVVRSPIVRGLPHLVELGRNTQLKFTLSTGLLQGWLEIEPATLIASSENERLSHDPEGQDEGSRPSLRMSVIEGGMSVASIPFSLQSPRLTGDYGNPKRGVMLETILLDWRIHAGSIRGEGDFGSYVHFAWRMANVAVDQFGPPVINPILKPRLPPQQRHESELGKHVRYRVDKRFILRRVSIRESL